VKSGEGTGLGLAISRRLTNLLGGNLVLSSSSASGSTFTFSLDLPSTQAAEEHPARWATGFAAPPRLAPILVADDSPANRRLLRELHRTLGLEVVEAANGPDALALFVAGRPPFVWTDALMPGFGGLELVRRIRVAERENDWPRTPVVAVTAGTLGDEREDLIAAGCDDVVRKPFEAGEIFTLLEAKLGLVIVYEEESRRAMRPLPVTAFQDEISETEWPAAMERLVGACETLDWTELRRSAHDLRGAASLAGRLELAETLAVIEQRAHARGPLESIRPMIARAQAQLSRGRSEPA
jgi:CheY-like chemotaxis protein